MSEHLGREEPFSPAGLESHLRALAFAATKKPKGWTRTSSKREGVIVSVWCGLSPDEFDEIMATLSKGQPADVVVESSSG